MSDENSKLITIVGGIYYENCLRPAWREIYGSAGRAASAMAAMGAFVEMHGYADSTADVVLKTRAELEQFKVVATPVKQNISFDYDHGLATPRIYDQLGVKPDLIITASNIVSFGLYEGNAVVHGERVVYDPQNAVDPKPFYENGSTAEELVLVLNRHEAMLMSGLKTMNTQEMAEKLIENSQANIVVIKEGAQGAVVYDGVQTVRVPVYQSNSVWKIGSGDVFVAHFAFRWLHERKTAVESAELASRATAYYCQTRGFPTTETLTQFATNPITPSKVFSKGRQPRVYLAGPFFTLAQLWLVEQVRNDLRSMGFKVFSPYHDVGHGCAEDVVLLDLEGIETSDILFAIGDGMDSGTVYEIGYARARGKPVVMYCENESEENKKMMEGSGCEICNDYVSSIYKTLWTACSL